MGNVIAFPVAGWISASTIGWPYVFYLYGAVGVIWSAIWMFVGSDCPAKHKFISPEERKYIESGIECNEGQEVGIGGKIALSLFNLSIFFRKCQLLGNRFSVPFPFGRYSSHIVDKTSASGRC